MDPPTNDSQQPCWADPTNNTSSSSNLQTQELHDVQQEEDMDTSTFLTQPYSTLDEPVSETIMRDVRSVAAKIKVVLLPLKKTNPLEYAYVSTEEHVEQDENQKKVLATLRDWDLWGPLVVCLSLSILLSARAPSTQASAVFAAVFCSMWLGSAIVTINAKLLGGTISFFQSVCVLGYSVFPFLLSALLILILSNTFLGHVWIDILWVLTGYVWSVRASVVFIGQYIKKERRMLSVMPVFFYYALLGWLVLLF
jgi:hypothetical protein